MRNITQGNKLAAVLDKIEIYQILANPVFNENFEMGSAVFIPEVS
jgi:hypothetical protein